jgi:hypothetical protein
MLAELHPASRNVLTQVIFAREFRAAVNTPARPEAQTLSQDTKVTWFYNGFALRID